MDNLRAGEHVRESRVRRDRGEELELPDVLPLSRGQETAEERGWNGVARMQNPVRLPAFGRHKNDYPEAGRDAVLVHRVGVDTHRGAGGRVDQ
eukprot:scaffold41350_cov208-Isochrysis_galbana.AAC.1